MKGSEDKLTAVTRFSNTVKAALPRIIVKKLKALTHDLADEICADGPGYGEALETAKIAIKAALILFPDLNRAEQPVSEPTLVFMIARAWDRMPTEEIDALLEIDEPAYLALRDEWEKDLDVSPFIERE